MTNVTEPAGRAAETSAAVFERAVPFAPLARLWVPDDFKRTELAWKLTTSEDNPVLWIPPAGDVAAGALRPSGFEPYFLGTGLTPRQIVEQIAEIGAQQLDYLAWRHSDDPYYEGRLLSVLAQGQISEHEPQRGQDRQMLIELDAILGALARGLGYRAQINPEARRYREDTHRLTDPFVRSLAYAADAPEQVVERYELPAVSRTAEVIAAELHDLPTFRARRGWQFMVLLGDRLGNGPVRAGLLDQWQHLPIQYRY
jgi:hypothetical protein